MKTRYVVMDERNDRVLYIYRSKLGGYASFKNLNFNSYHDLQVYKTLFMAKIYAMMYGGKVVKVLFRPLNPENIAGSYTWVCDRIYPKNGNATIYKCASNKIDFDNKHITTRFTDSGLAVCFDGAFFTHVDEMFEVVFV